jgi:hypothetical protein
MVDGSALFHSSLGSLRSRRGRIILQSVSRNPPVSQPSGIDLHDPGRAKAPVSGASEGLLSQAANRVLGNLKSLWKCAALTRHWAGTRVYLCLANCYFAHDSLRFSAMLPFFNASSHRPFHPLNRRPDPVAPTWRPPFPCGWRIVISPIIPYDSPPCCVLSALPIISPVRKHETCFYQVPWSHSY